MFTIPTGFSSTPSDVYIVSSDANAEVKTMELKAVNDGGTTKPVSGFIISPDNVVSVNQNGKVTVFSTFSLAFSGARLSDIGGNPRIIPISTNGEVSFATLPAGVYTLDVIVDDRLAYESIINIGQQPQQEVNQFITTVNQRTDVSETTIITCPVNSTLVNGTCVPSPSPIICPPNGTSTNQTDCPVIPLPNSTIPLPNGTFPNGTIPTPNGTLPNGTIPAPNGTLPNGTIPIATLNLTQPTSPGTNETEPTPPGTNETEPTPPGTNTTDPTSPGGGGDGGDNQTAFFEPPIECPEGEQVASDGLSCEPIPIECTEGEELVDGLCQIIPEECAEGEELVDGLCQPIPTDDVVPDEEISGDEGGGDEGGGDEGGGDEGGGDEGGGDEGGGDEGGGDEGGGEQQE
jgi:uncharacterized membrane protein YgcG